MFPDTLQEGFRYTAMHVAALKNKPEVCQVILDTIENPDFIQQLYSQSRHTEETQNNRINFLVDLYLNMPDKGVLYFSIVISFLTFSQTSPAFYVSAVQVF